MDETFFDVSKLSKEGLEGLNLESSLFRILGFLIVDLIGSSYTLQHVAFNMAIYKGKLRSGIICITKSIW